MFNTSVDGTVDRMTITIIDGKPAGITITLKDDKSLYDIRSKDRYALMTRTGDSVSFKSNIIGVGKTFTGFKNHSFNKNS